MLATVLMLLMLTKLAMVQVPMEVERILDEGPPMFLVDSIHMDARELNDVLSKNASVPRWSFKTVYPS